MPQDRVAFVKVTITQSGDIKIDVSGVASPAEMVYAAEMVIAMAVKRSLQTRAASSIEERLSKLGR